MALREYFITVNKTGIIRGKPSIAINAELFSAFDARAETRVRIVEIAETPRISQARNELKSATGLPSKVIKTIKMMEVIIDNMMKLYIDLLMMTVRGSSRL